MSDRLGELLVRENLISLSQLKDAQSSQRSTRESLTYTLAKLGMVGENDLTEFLSIMTRLPRSSLGGVSSPEPWHMQIGNSPD